jgi:hypothetical protein
MDQDKCGQEGPLAVEKQNEDGERRRPGKSVDATLETIRRNNREVKAGLAVRLAQLGLSEMGIERLLHLKNRGERKERS